jgi:metal-responsive CopG/Arc/MetJ family transcriptional regulator
MKTAISIPDPLYTEADRTAHRLGISRSELYALALRSYLEAQRGEPITEALNAVYTQEKSGLEPGVGEMQLASLPKEEW